MVGKIRRQLASELITELATIDREIKAANVQLRELLNKTRTGLLDLYGNGPSSAARILGDVGDISRFASRSHFASCKRHRTDRRLQR